MIHVVTGKLRVKKQGHFFDVFNGVRLSGAQQVLSADVNMRVNITCPTN